MMALEEKFDLQAGPGLSPAWPFSPHPLFLSVFLLLSSPIRT